MVRRVIVLVAVVLIMGLSLLAIQCDPNSKAPPEKKGLSPGIPKELKMPLEGSAKELHGGKKIKED